jgi:hypothetical protein
MSSNLFLGHTLRSAAGLIRRAVLAGGLLVAGVAAAAGEDLALTISDETLGMRSSNTTTLLPSSKANSFPTTSNETTTVTKLSVKT